MKSALWVKDRQMKLARAFHEHMTKDQSYFTSSPNRTDFYARVTAMTEEVNSLSFPFFCENDGYLQFAGNNELVGDEKKPGHFVSELEGPAEAGERLCRFIDEHHLLDPESGPRRPLVVLDRKSVV